MGKNLTKTQNKEDILNNQKIVANSLSNSNCQTHEKNNEFHNNPFEKNQTSIDDGNLKITRGWFDFKAINLRYINENIYIKCYPKNSTQQKLYKLLNYSRSIYLSYEFKGCEKNIKKYFDKLNLLFGYELDKKEIILFKSLIDFFEYKKNNKNLLKKYYPKLLESDFANIFKKINVQEKFSKECIKLIKKLTSDKKKEELSPTEKNEDLNDINQKKEQQKQKQKEKESKLFSDIFEKEGHKERINSINQLKRKIA